MGQKTLDSGVCVAFERLRRAETEMHVDFGPSMQARRALLASHAHLNPLLAKRIEFCVSVTDLIRYQRAS